MIEALPLSVPEFPAGAVWLVGAGPGDPGLLTLHAISALARADIVLYDALISPEILALIPPAVRREAVGKRSGEQGASQIWINERLVSFAREGLRVVRLKAGDPMVFGRGGEEALALAAASIPFRIIPGISAGIGALAACGIPLTHRGLARSAAFATGQEAGAGEVDWAALARGAEVLVLYMARRRMEVIAAALIRAGRSPNENVALIADATRPRQRVVAATLATATAAAELLPPAAPVLVVIGPVVALRDLLGRSLDAAPMGVVAAAGRSAA